MAFKGENTMAARTRKIRHDDETRAKIKASQLVNRLTDHALGKVGMTASQVTAALGLLKKALPDLAAIEHSGEVKQTFAVSPEMPTMEEWEAEFCKPQAPLNS